MDQFFIEKELDLFTTVLNSNKIRSEWTQFACSPEMPRYVPISIILNLNILFLYLFTKFWFLQIITDRFACYLVAHIHMNNK